MRLVLYFTYRTHDNAIFNLCIYDPYCLQNLFLCFEFIKDYLFAIMIIIVTFGALGAYYVQYTHFPGKRLPDQAISGNPALPVRGNKGKM